MDADSSYGGSDTAQDYHSAHENNSSFETSHTGTQHNHSQDKVTTTPIPTTALPAEEINNQFYHINEVTLPINYNENGYHTDESITQPKERQYLSTANLNINETLEHHSNLEEMNKQYKNTSLLNSESPRDMRKSISGIDNMVFEDDVPDQINVRSTFGNAKPYNGELLPSLALGIHSPHHNEEPMTEAVNLELINLKPIGKDVTGHYENVGNGMTTIPLKRENDTEVGNPYDEYFVPVNEHRKYMRGEKLYVTMDKRGKKNKGKCLCWGICLCIVAAALILGILAAVGVIGSQEPLQEVSARSFDGTKPQLKQGSLFSSAKISNTELPKDEHSMTTISNTPPSTKIPIIKVVTTESQEQEIKGRHLDGTKLEVYEENQYTSSKNTNMGPSIPFTPAPPISTISNIPPSTEMSMIQVPCSLDSEIIIDNIQFTPALAVTNSSEFNALATELRKVLIDMFNKDILQYGPANTKIKIKNFALGRAGSVIVNYRIACRLKSGNHYPKNSIEKDTLEKKISQFLELNNRFIGPYHISEMALTTEPILDVCKIDNNGCEYGCLFDYDILDFTCTCPDGKILSRNKKNCIEEPRYGNSDTDVISNFNSSKYEPNFESYTTTQSLLFVDTESNKESKYSIDSTLYPDISLQSETTMRSEAVTSFSSSTEENIVPDTEKYVTNPISDHLNEKENNSILNLNSKFEQSDGDKVNDYSNLSSILQTSTEYSLKHDNLTNVDTTISVTNVEQETTYPFDVTTGINDIERNKYSERLIAITTPSIDSVTNTESNSISTLKSLIEAITEVSNESTITSTIGSNLDVIEEHSSKKFIDDQQDDITVKTFIESTTRAVKKDTESEDNETYVTPETITQSYEFSEDKMHDLGFVKVVTPEAEIYTTPNPTISPEYADNNRVRKTLREKLKTEQSPNIINNEMNDKNNSIIKDITTQITQIGENELHFIPVIVNEDEDIEDINKTRGLPETNNFSTEMPASYTKSVLANISEDSEIDNQSPKIYEITTKQVLSEVKKDIKTSTQKHSDNMNVVERPENSLTDYMSPFLPEIENDTFANTLNSDDHFNDNIFISKHVDPRDNLTQYKTYPPPNLVNDQMNHTNPLDYPQNDTSLGVQPLYVNKKNRENIPVLQKEINDNDNITDFNIKYVTNKENLSLNSFTENKLDSTTVGTENYNEQNTTLIARENGIFVSESTTFSVTETTLYPIETTRTEREEVITEMMTEKYKAALLPPEIINNVHSNNYFENNSKMLEEQTILLNERITKDQELTTQTVAEMATTEIPLDIKTEYAEATTENETNMGDDSSTEDLVASETTTNRFKSGGEDQTQTTNSLLTYSMENSTENERITDITTEIVNFVTTEVINTSTEVISISTEEVNTSTSQSPPLRFRTPSLNAVSHYEVKENFADITTTEKLFVSVKPTTNIIAIVNQEDNEDLSIVPLEKEIVNKTKLDKKRLAYENSSNNLEQMDGNNSYNSIFNEDHNVDTFPENFNTIYSGDRPQSENVTYPNYTNKSSKDIQNEKKKLDKYNKTIFNKTIKKDNILIQEEKKVKTSHDDTVKPVTEDFILPRFTRCLADQFACSNGTYINDGSYCIPSNDRCDSVHDCSDGSDEVNCMEEGCPRNFQCSSGQCLKRYLVCDGIINCNDGSDEINCDKWACNFDEISCGSGSRCIPASWKCDGRSHCSDGSDELHCHLYNCANDTFHCREPDLCIPLSWKCDGKRDCVNGYDENLCECTTEQFKCEIGGGCIKMEEVCDGIEQCADRSDEWNCLRLEDVRNNIGETSHKNILQVRYKNNTWYPVCMDWSNWNTTYADQICQNLGFAGAMLLESVPKSKGFQVDGYYKLINPFKTFYGKSILSQLEKNEYDHCDQLVSITCQEFVCGNTESTDGSLDQYDVDGNKTLLKQLSSLGLLSDIKHNKYCTATILTPLWAIGSYSCMDAVTRSTDTSEWILSAGNINYNQTDNSTAQTRQIKQIIPHPQVKFSRFEFINDIVLIKLSQPLILNRNINTVCWPSTDTVPKQLCITAGWEFSKPGEHFKQQYIRHISGSLINSEECNSTKYYNGTITEDKICSAYNAEHTPCYNDKGAPLMCFSNATHTWELQGIKSQNCDGSTYPTQYSAINTQLRRWITNTIGRKAVVTNL